MKLRIVLVIIAVCTGLVQCKKRSPSKTNDFTSSETELGLKIRASGYIDRDCQTDPFYDFEESFRYINPETGQVSGRVTVPNCFRVKLEQIFVKNGIEKVYATGSASVSHISELAVFRLCTEQRKNLEAATANLGSRQTDMDSDPYWDSYDKLVNCTNNLAQPVAAYFYQMASAESPPELEKTNYIRRLQVKILSREEYDLLPEQVVGLYPTRLADSPKHYKFPVQAYVNLVASAILYEERISFSAADETRQLRANVARIVERRLAEEKGFVPGETYFKQILDFPRQCFRSLGKQCLHYACSKQEKKDNGRFEETDQEQCTYSFFDVIKSVGFLVLTPIHGMAAMDYALDRNPDSRAEVREYFADVLTLLESGASLRDIERELEKSETLRSMIKLLGLEGIENRLSVYPGPTIPKATKATKP